MNTQPTKFNFLKKCFLKFSILFCAVIATASLLSCSNNGLNIYTGIPVDKELVWDFSKSIEKENDIDLSVDIPNCVFWVKDSMYFHLSRDCHYLANSKEIFFGDEEKARIDGKREVCSQCQKRVDKAAEEENEKNMYGVEEGVYYWTENGGVYHNSVKCSYIKNSENIIRGSLEEANDMGKTKMCSACKKRQ